MGKQLPLIIVSVAVLFAIAMYGGTRNENNSAPNMTALAARFEMLSQGSNSSCSLDFMNSIDGMASGSRLRGSCCSAMDFHRYGEQMEGLKKFQNIPEIPPDPYDIDATLARELKSHYDDELTTEEQIAYDYAMENSNEKGPCCCKCWRWYVYGGLGKLLIKQYGFTGDQVTEVWNLSDGCGGAGEHAHNDKDMQ